jgi:hypothetical protein
MVGLQFMCDLTDGSPRPTGSLCSPGTHIKYQDGLADMHWISSASPTFDGDQWVVAEVLVLGAERIVNY